MTAARKFDEDTLVLASHNAKKLDEIKAMLGDFATHFDTAGNLGVDDVEETEDTFEGNAMLKAVAVAKATGKVSLADDSGFCVDGLDGAPGVYSARWAEDEQGNRDFDKAMKKIEQLLHLNPNKKARFVSVFALAWPDGHVEYARGEVEGSVTFPPRGEKGFGYDPIFVPNGHERTFAQMSAEEKRALSHRGKAFDILVEKCFRR